MFGFGWLGSLFGRGAPADLAADQIRHDIISQPFGHSPLSLDPAGGETPQMREMYLDLYQKEGVVRAAVNGLVDAVASADVTAEPADRSDPASRDVAEFLMWSVDQSEGGWPAILTDTTLPALLFGHSLGEPTLQPAPHPTRGQAWALRHLRSLDTRFLRLRTDVFRNVTQVISTVRGMEPFDPAKVVLFTYRRVFHNPFGNPTMRAAYRDACLIEDAYKLWYLALKMYGEPYLYGKVKDATRRKQMQDSLAALRAGGVLVSPVEDDVQILSLSTAVNFAAFEAKVKNLRENVFLAIRGAYLPFVEGVGGSDAHGDTEVGKLSSDTSEYLLSQAVGRCLNKQLVPKLIYPNFGEGTPLPTLKLGGLNWDKIKNAGDTLEKVKKAFPGRLSMSAKRVAAILGIPPAEGPDDEINVNEAGPDDGGGGGPQPGGGAPAPAPAQLPAGSATDGPATPAPVPAAPAPPSTDFSAGDAAAYATHFRADPHGRYPGSMHESYGLRLGDFARLTGLQRQEVGRGDNRRWLWAPAATPAADRTFSADPAPAGTDAPTSTPGALEAGVAMMEAYRDGDDALADAIAELADDPDGLAELVADVEAGTHGQPGVKALSAMVRTFAAGTRWFGWVADPTPRSKGRATNTESGTHAYGNRAQQLLAAQGRQDRGEPEPEHPARAKARELKAEREPAREKARAAWAKVTTAPHTMTADDLGALREHLDSLTRDEVRAAVKAVRGGGHGGKLKAELVDALKDHARETMAGAAAANVREKPADPARLALAGMLPNRHKTVTADGEEIPAGKGYERWEGDRKVGYTAAQAAKVAAGVTADEGARRIADHERAAADPKLDEFERDRHADTAAVLREHHAAAFPAGAGGKAGGVEETPATGVAKDSPAAARGRMVPPDRGGSVGTAPDVRPAAGGGKPPAADPALAPVLAAHAAAPAGSKLRDYLDAAVANASPAGHDASNPPKSLTPEQGRRLRKELASAHADAHQAGNLTPEDDAAFGKVMQGLGVKPLHEVGATVPFDPATMESSSGVSTGTPVTVGRRGWSGLYGDAGVGHENVGNNVRRAVVSPAGKPARTFAAAPDAPPTHAGLCVRAADTGRALLLRRADTPGDPAAGLWEFPGGRIEPGESPADAACREWREEVGAELPEGEPAGTWRGGVYAGHVLEVPTEAAVSLDGRAGDRGEEVAWRHPDDMDADDVRPELAGSMDDVTRAFAAGPPRDGLVPKTGDAEHPGRWVRPDKAGGSSGSSSAPAGGGGADAPTSTPAGQGGPPAAETRAAVDDAVRTADPEAAASPGLLSRLGDKAVTAAAKAHIALTRLTPAMLKAVDAVSAVLDTPDDAKKFGYAFGSSGSAAEAAGGGADPVKASLGINSHLAATIAAKVVGAGLVWVKNKTGVKLYADEGGDVALAAAEALHAAFAAVAREFGLSAPPGVEVIAERIRAAGGGA